MILDQMWEADMPRLFVGLEVPVDIGEQLASFRGGLPGARWISAENYHLTLRFIGDIDGREAEDVDAALAEARPRHPVRIDFEALDSFGGDRPHAVIARVQPTRELTELQAEAERAVRRAGLPPERRKFVPHVTVARLRNTHPVDVAAYLAARGHFPRFGFSADRVSLFSAREQTGGGPYVVEAAYPFSGVEMVAYR
jgi:RNA 2',3'-cyclic 3'-phosphodiesterase